jgi:ribonuclease T2
MTRVAQLTLFSLLIAGFAGQVLVSVAQASPVLAEQSSTSGEPDTSVAVTNFGARLVPASSRHARPATNSQPGQFDYYLFTLSWSPQFCATHSSSECSSHPGFVVHGMWPQNNDGTFPENCSQAAGPSNPQQYLDLIPTVALIAHEWATHGTCSGLAPDAYFTAIRSAFQSMKIPAAFVTVSQQETLAPSAIIGDFATANPSWPSGSIALSCGNNSLTAVQVCLSKTLTAEACQNVHTCGATVVKITPQ